MLGRPTTIRRSVQRHTIIIRMSSPSLTNGVACTPERERTFSDELIWATRTGCDPFRPENRPRLSHPIVRVLATVRLPAAAGENDPLVLHVLYISALPSAAASFRLVLRTDGVQLETCTHGALGKTAAARQ